MNILHPLHRSRHAASLRAAAGSPGGRAFTLIEMMIAVGAVGIIAIGIAKMFSSTGEVVKLGLRSSALNEMAATLESQIRRDITAIAGQGEAFLVIRNKLLLADPATIDPITNQYIGIPLSADDRNPSPRPRRIDEIVFFTHGSYTSAREPLFPGRAPQGSAARIYYGHGMQRETYDTPRLDADPIWSTAPVNRWPEGLGRKQANGADGANTYAGSWTLLRHSTVLTRPQQTDWKVAPNAPSYLGNANWQDTLVQNGLQPAAASIFRFDPARPNNPDILGYGYMTATTATGPITGATYKAPPTINASQIARPNDANIAANPFPSFVGGLVDVASVDLSQIRARIIGLGPNVGAAYGPPAFPPVQLLRDDTFANRGYPQAVATRMTLQNTPTPPDAAFTNTNYLNTSANPGPNIAHLQKMMMASALPSNDPWLFGTGGSMAQPVQNRGGFTNSNPPDEQRMICAPTPPDFTGNLTNGGHAWNADEPYRQHDQAMLSASNLVAGCTEFIVEWSFGDVYTYNSTNTADTRPGQIIWHGRYRKVAGGTDVQPYRAGTTYNSGSTLDGVAEGGSLIPAALIHWPVDIPNTGANTPWTSGAWPEEQPVYSFFGYHDPSYSGTRDWPWPKLLRFTIGLTDPADPTFEQVVQFVVEIPSRQHLQ